MIILILGPTQIICCYISLVPRPAPPRGGAWVRGYCYMYIPQE